MIAYYCDRCGKAIVDGTIYRVAITAESVSILGTEDTLATTFEADAVKARCYCGECKREIKSFLYNGEEQEQPEEQPEGWKARMLENSRKEYNDCGSSTENSVGGAYARHKTDQ